MWETTVPGRLFRNHPLLVATTAASGGVMLGAYVAFQIFAAPVEQRGAGQPAPLQPVAQANAGDTKAPAIAETTGSAPARDDVAADRCEGQTWPNLTRNCMEQMRSRTPTRTVTTDRVENPAPQMRTAPQAPSGTAVANAPAIAPAPEAAPESGPAAQPANTQTAAAPAPAAEPAAATANPPEAVKSVKRKVKEAKRKAKNPKSEQGDNRALAYAPNGDRDDEQQFDRNDRRSLRAEDRDGRFDRSRRERVIVRGEDDDDGDRVSERGDRRVIVIRRERESGGFGGGGIFGSLFGN
jgi:hypothetical protein